MRMICRRHYPIVLALVVFIGFQVFLKLNQHILNTRVIAPDFPLDAQQKVVQEDKKKENDAGDQNPDNNQINNGEPIDKILENREDDDDNKNKNLDNKPEDLLRADPPKEENKPKEEDMPIFPKEDEPKAGNALEKVDEQKDQKKEEQNDEIKKLKEAANEQKLDQNNKEEPKLNENKEEPKHVEDTDPDIGVKHEEPNKSEVLLQPDESEAKKMIAQDVLNDENDNAKPSKDHEDKDQELFVFPDDNEDADMYKMDYSVSHPFENQCRYPVLKRDEADLLKNVRHYRKVQCPPAKNDTIPLISQLPSGEIMVGVPHRAKFRAGIKCMGREISGTLRRNKRKIIEVGDWFEIPQDRRVFVNKDQFIVKCKDKAGKVLLEDVYASLPEKPRLKPESVEQPGKYNINLFIIDSTARNQFFRHMPLTMKFMRQHDFKFLHGHTKVGDNSAINLLPLLAGKVYDLNKRGFEGLARQDMLVTDAMLKEDFWKYSDMLIQIARDHGCPTLWNDDIASVGFGLFNYYAFPGFNTPPADYFYRPYYVYLYSKLNAGSSCANGEFLVPRYVQIWERFARRFAKECHFAFNFMTGLTHASSSNLELYDQDLTASLTRMEQDGVLDHSFIFIMGDHGQRISAIQKSYTGRIEERMPLVGIHIPQKFRQQYPEKVKQLEINQNRLTSNFDLHETLREIMGLDKGREPVGRSIFHEIPIDRNCTDARVPHNFCMCQEKVNEGLLNENEKNDILDVFAAEVGIFFAEASDCVKSHKIGRVTSFTPYTINSQSRIGIRYPKEWLRYLEKNSEPKLEDNEFFDVEFEPTVEIQTTKSGKTMSLNMKARVLWNKVDQTGRLTATPLITNKPCGGIERLENVCQCNEQ